MDRVNCGDHRAGVHNARRDQELGLCNLRKIRLRENLIVVFKYKTALEGTDSSW